MPVQTTDKQLATVLKCVMFALTCVGVNVEQETLRMQWLILHSWIEAMLEELHQFDRLKVLGTSRPKPFGKMIIKLKVLWKNKKDEDLEYIRNKARL
ncbi:hypothetical protein Tco_0290370 [Tanacetum coccineum]